MRHSEIGGYMEFERFEGLHYHDKAIALNSGRGCLAYHVELRGVGTIWVPDYLCDSVPSLFRREGVTVKTYRIGMNMRPDYKSFDVLPGEWMLLVDYYGQLESSDIEEARIASNERLIVDESQSFFRRPWPSVDIFYTCRKWFGVSDGGFLVLHDGACLKRSLERDESFSRMGFVLARFERPASEFFAEASANNLFFAEEPAKTMSLLTENILQIISYDDVKRKRNDNWHFLSEKLSKLNALDFHAPDGAFAYPFYIEGAQELRKRLIDQKIYVPCLWPNVLKEEEEGSAALALSKNILPLPLDQRYGIEDMEYVVDCLLKSIEACGFSI